jgi:DNA-binding LacI/PurR family transcriptional regulator
METSVVTNYNSKASKVAEILAGEIQTGKYASGTLLPTESELARLHGVTPKTLRKSFAILAERGQVVRLPQRGVLVPKNDSSNSSFADSGSQTAKKISIATFWAMAPDYALAQRLAGIRRYTENHNIQFRDYLASTNEETLDALEHVEDYGVDGVIVYLYKDPRYTAVIARLLEKRFPVVTFRAMDNLPVSFVGSDLMGGYTATHYLIHKYQRPVYYITERVEGDCAPERFNAYHSAMVDAGFGELVDSHTWRMETDSMDTTYWPLEKKWLPGYHTAKKYLAQVKTPISIFTANSYVASGVYKAAEEYGLAIGKDICLVGMDDLPLCTRLKPTMTTLRTNIEEFGFEAARLLHQMVLKKIQPPIYLRLPWELIERESA